MIDNQDKKFKNNDGVLGRLVDEAGEPKEPSHCIIQYGGRVRLPDKLMEILNKEFAPDVMWWQPDGECFAFDSAKVQKKILDVWFRGTKLSSFIRSLNRWGFRRVFYHALPEAALAFHHSSFRKESSPEMLKSMKMSKSGKAAAAKAEEVPSVASLPKGLFHPMIESPSPASSRLSPLSQVAMPTAALSLSTMLPQLPLSNNNARASVDTSSVDQQEALLKLLSDQRSRDLLTLAAANRGASLPSTSSLGASLSSAFPSLQRALAAQQEHEQQRAREEEQQKLLLLVRAEQERLAQQGRAQQQQEQQRKETALRMAILALKSRQNQSLL